MKRSISLLLGFTLSCALLAGCGGKTVPQSGADGGTDESAVLRCRVIEAGDGDQLLLAVADAERSDIYTLDAGGLSLYRGQAEDGELLIDGQLAAGARIEVACSGEI